MRVERLLFLALAVSFSLVLSVSAIAADDDGDDRVFQRVASVPNGEAIVYVYRRRKGAGSAAPIGFDVNDALTGALWSGRYETVAVPPGSVTVRARGVGEVAFKCATADKGWLTRWVLKGGKSSLSHLGVYGGPKWETTFKAEAGREYFVEVAPGLRVYVQTEEAAMEHKLTTLKRAKRVFVFLSKSEAEQVARKVEQDCSESRLSDAYRSTIKAVGPRAVD
jgi:hypothetical protein